MEKEKRLIDANKLKDRFKLRLDWLQLDVHNEYTKGLYHGCDYDMTLINEQPTVDAVEVVRCEDCLYRSQYPDESGHYKCGGLLTEDEELLLMVKPDFFCAYGERRENDG